MKRIARTAVTGVIQRGGINVKFTKETLESIGNTDSASAIPITPGHDPFCMPIGKVESTWIEAYGEEHAAMAQLHIEEEYQNITHISTETPLVLLHFKDSPKPFVRGFNDLDEVPLTVCTDLANFSSNMDHSEFLADVSDIDAKAKSKIIGRHSLVPEPILQFLISNPELSTALGVTTLWTGKRVEKFLRYTVDQTLQKIGDDIADSLSGKIRKILTSYKGRKSPDDRPVLVQVVIVGETDFVLLDRVPNEQRVSPIDLQELVSAIERYGDLLEIAQEVTFARSESGDWEFQYLKTRQGQVIGTLACQERTVQTYQKQRRND